MNAEYTLIKHCLYEAGNICRGFSSKDLNVREKSQNQPVTEADIAVDQYLYQTIITAYPNDGWLSEELEDNIERLKSQRVWIVDPIDGTKQFIQGLPEYTISIALVENHQPIVGGIYNPELDLMWLIKQGADLVCNDQPIKPALRNDEKVLILGRSSIELGNYQVIRMGSVANRIAQVAAGKANAAVTLHPISEWDVAAGVLMAREQGLVVTDLQGKDIQFNQVNTEINGIIVAQRNLHRDLLAQAKIMKSKLE